MIPCIHVTIINNYFLFTSSINSGFINGTYIQVSQLKETADFVNIEIYLYLSGDI